MAWAFGQRVGSPMAKLVLLSLADRHNDETGADPFPSIETIGAETEMNERSVRRHLETLEAAGLIARRARGRGKFYRLSLPPKPDTESGAAPSSPPTTPDSVSATPDSLTKTPDTESTEPERTDSNRKRTGERARKRADRATRLPADWRPSQADTEFARKEGLDDGHIQRAADRFRDYWHAQPGQRGIKRDWSATWRNWVRRDAESLRAGLSPGSAGARPTVGGRRTQREIQQDMAQAAAAVVHRRRLRSTDGAE